MNGANLEVNSLVGGYGNVTVVHDVSFRALAGQITALIGSNGAGKSTTLRMLSGLLPMAGGRIQLDGCSISDFSAHQRVDDGLVMVPEGREPLAPLDGRVQVLGPLVPRPREAILPAHAAVGKIFKYPSQMSSQINGILLGLLLGYF